MRISLRAFATMNRSFLFWFSNEHSNFRVPELEALFKVFHLDEKVLQARKEHGPYILMDFPNEEGPKKIMSRSVLAHAVYEIWGDGATKEELDESVKKNLSLIEPFRNNSFQFRVDTYGKAIPQKEKIEIMDSLAYLPLKGKIDLKNPEYSFHVLLYYGLIAHQAPEMPYHWYFGRWICDGQRQLVWLTNLKKRKFIGNTSMDPLLSLIMVNLAASRPNSLVLDPFVGTGSILVAAAVSGCYVMGSDIDYLMLHGKTKPTRPWQDIRTEDENIRANMTQYGVEDKYLDVVIGDASRPLWRDDMRFDAIIADPPYGIREPTERLGASTPLEPGFKLKPEHIANHYPQKRDYALTDIFCDLMDTAAQKLEIGGRLVYWIPISRSDYDEGKLPKNPCFTLRSNSEQILTTIASRRLLVFEKTCEPTASCQTVIDGSALMYRFKFFDTTDRPSKKEDRKSNAISTHGKTSTKRGQLLPQMEGMSISNKQ